MKTVAVVGLGLVGGSLSRALVGAGHAVVGVDTPAVRRRARLAGAVSATVSTLEEAALVADVVVLAAPPEANLRLLVRAARCIRPGTVITDVGSVKGPICARARALRLRTFVGGHPMAGSEASGFDASSADLFRGHPWILVPAGGSPAALAAARGLARAVGGRPVVVAPDEHDRAMAFLSHMPQVVAWAIAEASRRDPVAARHLGLAGNGFRDMTRLARSPRGLWRQILGQNRRAIAGAMRVLRAELLRLERSPPRGKT